MLQSATSPFQTGGQQQALFGAAPAAASLAQRLVGRTYQVRREGEKESFALVFQQGGILLIDYGEQKVQEQWQPSARSPGSVVLGGRVMPTADVVIGPRGFGSDPDGLWESSPPAGAAPLVGTWLQGVLERS